MVPPAQLAVIAAEAAARAGLCFLDEGSGVPVMPQGAFYVYARSDGFDADSMRLARRLLDEAGVAAVPGCDFGDHEPDAHLRFSYTTSLDQIREGVRRLTDWASVATRKE